MSSVYLYPGGDAFGDECARLCGQAGFSMAREPHDAVFALAPRLIRKLSRFEWDAPGLGTLIFHPSILPYHRGPDAIRQTVRLGERVSGATWFWCDDGLDTGQICEQEPLLLKPGESAGRAYHTRFIPAGLRALARALVGLKAGHPNRIVQDETLATYESFIHPEAKLSHAVSP